MSEMFGGAPPSITIPAPAQDDGGDTQDDPGTDPDSAIADALQQIRDALSADGLSEQEKLILEKVTTLLQGLPATREKEQQAALGGGPATNFLRRASGSG